MKTFYSEYAQHCMRFYARHSNPTFKSDADKRNWNACKSAMNGFTQSEQDIILQVYQDDDTIPDNIYKIAIEKHIKQDKIWQLINKLEHRIVKRRNLL